MQYATANVICLKKGANVRVRCVSGELRENIVWIDHGDVVMVCAEDQFGRLVSGKPAPMPIGFKRVDVFPVSASGQLPSN